MVSSKVRLPAISVLRAGGQNTTLVQMKKKRFLPSKKRHKKILFCRDIYCYVRFIEEISSGIICSAKESDFIKKRANNAASFGTKVAVFAVRKNRFFICKF